MPKSAFIVPVPESQACVGSLRERFDASVRQGVPAHITVLVPFMSPELITQSVLGEIAAVIREIPAFDFSLREVARFPATAYLAPEPAAPFIALTEALARKFPAFPPFGGEHTSVIPHLSVAHGSAAEAELAASELQATMLSHGPIHSSCNAVVLLENASGMWREMHVFELGE